MLFVRACVIFLIQWAEMGHLLSQLSEVGTTLWRRCPHSLLLFFWLSVGAFTLTHSQIGGFDVCVQLVKMSDWIQRMWLFVCFISANGWQLLHRTVISVSLSLNRICRTVPSWQFKSNTQALVCKGLLIYRLKLCNSEFLHFNLDRCFKYDKVNCVWVCTRKGLTFTKQLLKVWRNYSELAFRKMLSLDLFFKSIQLESRRKKTKMLKRQEISR